MQGPYRKLLSPRFLSTSLRGPGVNNEGLVFHSTGRAIRLINSLLHSENSYIPKIHRENLLRKFAEKIIIFRKIIFREISPKSFSEGFLLIFKFSENCPKTHREFPEK